MRQELNLLPVKTWSWLGVNAASLKGALPAAVPYRRQPLPEAVDGLAVTAIELAGERLATLPDAMDAGVSRQMRQWIISRHNSGCLLEVAAGQTIKRPVLLSYHLNRENPVLLDDVVIIAGENSELTLVVDYAGTEGSDGFHSGLCRIHAARGATVNVIKAQRLPDDIVHLDGVGADIAEGASVNVTLAELGAGRSLTSCKLRLLGEDSFAGIRSLYLGDKSRELDINYLITHAGKASRSRIEARGALLDASSKIFRGTLDFIKGAAGAKGSEEEYTVLLSPAVRNRSTPLLLCGEADVEGQHAASTGKLDENKLFYLMSRGLSETDAKKLIIEASLRPVLDQIPVLSLQETITTYIRRRLADV